MPTTANSFDDVIRVAANRLSSRLRELDALVSKSNALAEKLGALKRRQLDVEGMLQAWLSSELPMDSRIKNQASNGIAFYWLFHEISSVTASEMRQQQLEHYDIRSEIAMLQEQLIQELRVLSAPSRGPC